MQVLRYVSVDSTQERARALLREGVVAGKPVVVAAEEQSAGRGRLGRVWLSPRGGLYMTCILSLGKSPHLEGISLSAGLALCEFLEEFAPLPAGTLQIKWPNDIHAGGCKIAGILCETVRDTGRPFLLTGVGVNIERSPVLREVGREVQPGVAAPAVCLSEAAARPIEARGLIEPLARQLRDRLERHLRQGLVEVARVAIEARLRGLGSPLEVREPTGDMVSGVLLGLTAEGLMRIGTEDGEIIACGGAEIARLHDNRLPRKPPSPGETPSI